MINVAVIGAGYWGPNLIRNCVSIQDCDVKVVCDASEDRRSYVKGLYPSVEVTADSSHVISDPSIDAVIIATPVSTHHPLAKACLESGKHVFVEKPLSRSVNECEDLVTLADSVNRNLMVGHTFVYTSVVRKIKEIVDSGEIGKVMYIGSRRLNLGLFQKDINVAWDLAPHDISIILYVLGQMPVSVNCQGRAHINPGIEDVTNMSLNFENGTIAMVQSSWIDPRKVRETTIVGTDKMLVYDDNEPLEKLKIYDKRVEVPPHYDTFAEFTYSYHYGDVSIQYLKQTEPLRVECQNFFDSINSGTSCDSSGIDGMNVVKILEASSASLEQNGTAVKI